MFFLQRFDINGARPFDFMAKKGINWAKFYDPMRNLIILSVLVYCVAPIKAQEPVPSSGMAKEDTTVYHWVDRMPLFRGCDPEDANAGTCSAREMTLYLYKNMRYPTDALNANTRGTTLIAAVIDKSGKTKRTTIRTSSGSLSLDEEARRLVQAMPEWSPGILKDRVVLVEVEIPVTFHPQLFKRE